MNLRNCVLLAAMPLFSMCGQQQAGKTRATDSTAIAKPAPVAKYSTINTAYHALAAKDSIKHLGKYLQGGQYDVLLAVNRVDSQNISKLDTVIVPNDLTGSVNQYTPYPQLLPFLNDVNKLIFFSYGAEYFAAYEHGVLVRTGPTNMGRQKDPTPTGLFHTNWKAEETKSTFNDEWDLKWNFNIQNKEGVGFHQYALPGYPASHSCLRLMEADAKYLYSWADEWKLKGTDNILANGTPVIVFGSYPFGSAKPWLQLLQNPHALDISVVQLRQESAQFLADIKTQQAKRESLVKKGVASK